MFWSIEDSLKKMKKVSNTTEASKYEDKAREYALQGFDFESVEELLYIDGCSEDVARELSVAACSNIPHKYAEYQRPQCYDDVKGHIDRIIVEASGDYIKDSLQLYFDKYVSRKYASLASKILLAHDNPSTLFVSEIHNSLKPLVEDLIISNNIMYQDNIKTASSEVDEKERLEYDLFGVWPVYMIKTQKQRIQAEKDIVEKYIEG